MRKKSLIDIIDASLRESAAVSASIESSVTSAPIIEAVDMLQTCLDEGGKVLLMGNGGSASDSEHMAAELTGRFEVERKPLPFICLNASTSLITAVGNDFGFGEIFSRQIDALAQEGDLVVCFSTSGESKNVVEGAMKAREKGIGVIAFVSEGDNTLFRIADVALRAPSTRTCRVQEAHIALVHVICECLEAIASDRGRE